ncbi:hypothetical protein SAMN05421810_11093 [Amycolatopsis arida]|uniref:Uncharacterized protein n=1 Tax=Amycolatopsis arida TaxID=587909 RepID=A0A1I5ZRX4_9PSEU|nr:hypothetical protein [Amycolatopsis arida]TDX89327.1 hypothetical protein CLV69_11094 [Amycolatopsis arida]SFQ59208.1 hypothetical protein SAMN05421810_11093 [Amycolatopsis arida]
MAPEQPLPAQPFLRCAGDVVARFGTPRLRTVQLLLPVQNLAPRERGPVPSLDTAGWFADRDPGSRTPVRVTVDSGRVPSVPAAAPSIHTWLRSLDQEVFAVDSHPSTDHDPLAAAPPLDDTFWSGPPRHRASVTGALAEWSLDALGWLAGLLAEGLARHGVTTPVVLTASEAG